MEGSPQVLVQGTAAVDDADLAANRARYRRESLIKLPATKELMPPKIVEGLLGWYYDRIYVKTTPERVLIWPDGDATRPPEIHGEPLAGLDEDPAGAPAANAGVWDERIDELGSRYDSAVLAWEVPGDFPCAARLPVRTDAPARRIVFDAPPAGLPVRLGPACVTAHSHSPEFLWQENFQVRGELVREGGGLVLVPRKLVGGFELPKESRLAGVRRNFAKARRFSRIAKERRRRVR